MIKAVIVEDEPNAQKALQKLLQLVAPQVTIIQTFNTIKKAAFYLKNNSIDLVFLDIELEDGSGFELLETLKKYTLKVIFTTAYSEFAIKAFRVNALDYLLKPIDPTELKAAISKIENNDYKIEEKQLCLKTTQETFFLKESEIIRLEAKGAYTLIVTVKKSILISKNLKYYFNLLNPKKFIRCHQSHVVSKDKISGLKNDDIILTNNEKIPISVRKKAEISTLFTRN